MNFEILPTEILMKIFDYCHAMDYYKEDAAFKSLSLVCRRWCDILTKFYHKKFAITVKYAEKSLNKLYRLFEFTSFRYLYDITILSCGYTRHDQKDNKLKLLIKLFTLPNVKIMYLSLAGLHIAIGLFSEMIAPLHCLKRLRLSSTVIQNGPIQLNKIGQFSKILSQINYFVYENIKKFSNVNGLLQIVSYTKELEYLKILDYGACDNKSIFAHVLFTALTRNSSTLKELNITLPGIIEKMIEENNSLNLLQFLNIKKFGADVEYTSNIIPFLKINSNISDLDLCDGNIDLQIIPEILKNLKSLNIINAEVENFNLLSISKFQNLRHLCLYSCTYNFKIYPQNYKIENVKCLTIACSECENKKIFLEIAKNMPNIEILIIFGEKNFNNASMQAIIKNLTKLTILSVRWCKNLTFFGVTGFDKKQNKQTGYSIKDLKNLKKLELDHNLHNLIAEYMGNANCLRWRLGDNTPNTNL